MKLIYFGMIAEATGKQQELIEPLDSVKILSEFIIKKYPKIAQINFKIAVNQSLVNSNISLKQHDEIAILPPFAGG